MKGISIHIGVTKLDYVPEDNGRKLDELKSSIHDAEVMRNLMGKGFENSSVLGNAKKEEVEYAFNQAKKQFNADGGILVITFSGHGVQIEDTNGDEGLKSDFDSCWCLKDQILLDETITDLLTDFNENVRIVVVSDSCHSGTVVDFKRIGYTKDLIELAEKKGVDFKNFESKILSSKGFEFAKFNEPKFAEDLEILKVPEIEKIREKNLEVRQRELVIEKFNDFFKEITKTKRKTIPKKNILDFINNLNDFNLDNSKQNKSILEEKNFSMSLNKIDIFADLSKIPLIENVKNLPRDLVDQIIEAKSKEIKDDRDFAKKSLQKKLDNLNMETVKNLVDSKQIILLSACKDDEVTKSGCSENDNSYFVQAIVEIIKSFPVGKGYSYLHEKLQEKLKSYCINECVDNKKCILHEQTPQISHSANISTDFLNSKMPFTI